MEYAEASVLSPVASRMECEESTKSSNPHAPSRVEITHEANAIQVGLPGLDAVDFCFRQNSPDIDSFNGPITAACQWLAPEVTGRIDAGIMRKRLAAVHDFIPDADLRKDCLCRSSIDASK